MDEDEEKIAVAATFGISAVFGKSSPKCSPSKSRHHSNLSAKPSPLVIIEKQILFEDMAFIIIIFL